MLTKVGLLIKKVKRKERKLLLVGGGCFGRGGHEVVGKLLHDTFKVLDAHLVASASGREPGLDIETHAE